MSIKVYRCRLHTDVSKAPTEFRIFEAGLNESDHGPSQFTDVSSKEVIKAIGNRDVMIDLEHLSLDPKAPAFDPDARGWCKLAIRNGELWAVNVRWTPEGKQRIESRTQRYISPVFYANRKTGVISKLVNLALTASPAMHNIPALIAANTKGVTMFPKELLDMLGLKEGATLADVMQAISDLQRSVAAAADEAGAGDAAAAIDAAADASADAAAASEGVEQATAASTARAIAAVIKPLVAEVQSLHRRLDGDTRVRLMASRQFKPSERAWLDKMGIEVVASYIAALPPEAPVVPRATGATPDDAELTPEMAYACSIMGLDPTNVKKQREKDISREKLNKERAPMRNGGNAQ